MGKNNELVSKTENTSTTHYADVNNKSVSLNLLLFAFVAISIIGLFWSARGPNSERQEPIVEKNTAVSVIQKESSLIISHESSDVTESDNLKTSSTQVLWESFDNLVSDGDNYQAALVMKELCKRGNYSTTHEQGMLELNCKVVQNSSLRDVFFDQGGGSGFIDFRGMARLK